LVVDAPAAAADASSDDGAQGDDDDAERSSDERWPLLSAEQRESCRLRAWTNQQAGQDTPCGLELLTLESSGEIGSRLRWRRRRGRLV